MDRRIPTERPSIAVLVHRDIAEEVLNPVRYGAEEEGVPITLGRTDNQDAFAIAHQAATQAQLDIGVGISGHMAIITTRRLPQNRPYLITGFGVDPEADRVIGANAARLVKRTPLGMKHFISIHDVLRSAQTALENNV
ncbi:glycerol dehydratase reactivase beta/small subunit family protein [Stomatohabitans albus]|uniref:glycerol dehydratase reactivase beta/small subunit family protein n=1 Tax=Stomatohabitans albus TaxID=3110766 RepID=UPI00300C6E77